MRQRLLVSAAAVLVVALVLATVVGNPFAAASVGPPVTGGSGTGTGTGTGTPAATDAATGTAGDGTATASATPAPRTHTPGPDGYDWRTVTVHDRASGTRLAAVDVRLADTFQKRYTGLSDTESLGPDEGMLFVHPAEGNHTYVMREMAFPLDIVFINASGNVTRIHHAPLASETPEDDLVGYRGYGKYVLEVPMNYTTDRGIEEGDYIRIRDVDLNGTPTGAICPCDPVPVEPSTGPSTGATAR